MAGVHDDPAQFGEQRGIFRADRYAQAPCRNPLRDHGAHAAGRASTMACSESTVPPRITRSSALRPMLSEARGVAILRGLRVGVPLTGKTMSPATMTALAAGPARPARPGGMTAPKAHAHAAGAVGAEGEPQRSSVHFTTHQCWYFDGSLQAQRGNVGARIASGELRVHHRPAGYDQLELVA